MIRILYQKRPPSATFFLAVVSLEPAATYQRPAWRPSPEHQGAVDRALMALQRPSPPGDALAAGCADARRLRRAASLTASRHRGVRTRLLAVATVGRARAGPRVASR